MKPKATKSSQVNFFATTRLAQVYRCAAKRNRLLARFGAIHEFGEVSSFQNLLGSAHDLEMVVLSHADDDYQVLTCSEFQPLVSSAFHLLFADTSTHHDQVAQWIRTTNIRAENRLHIITVNDLESPQVSELLGRVCHNKGGILDMRLSGNHLLVRGPKHRVLHVPVECLSCLKGQPRNVLLNFQIDPDGSFVYWPEIDVHLGWNQFLQAVDPDEHKKAQQRSTNFNKRYGEAIRALREGAKLSQSSVEGLTDRQLRRIEQGECRATANAMAALAKAHGLHLNDYMDLLSKTMK